MVHCFCGGSLLLLKEGNGGRGKKFHCLLLFLILVRKCKMFMDKNRAFPSKRKRKIYMISKLPYLSPADRSEKWKPLLIFTDFVLPDGAWHFQTNVMGKIGMDGKQIIIVSILFYNSDHLQLHKLINLISDYSSYNSTESKTRINRSWSASQMKIKIF